MTSATGIWNTAHAQPASPIAAKPMDSSGADSTTSSSSTISSNDFLTLLVTEMQNQDPTSATDPNQYINQLVSVNSLQQLIQINQTLSGLVVIPPSRSTGPIPATTVTSRVCRSTRTRAFGLAQRGTHRLPNPTASPAQGLPGTGTLATNPLVRGSI